MSARGPQARSVPGVAESVDALCAALTRRDLGALEHSIGVLAQALRDAPGQPLAAQDAERLRRALGAAGELVARAAGSNQRALAALFGPADTYSAGVGGAAPGPARGRGYVSA